MSTHTQATTGRSAMYEFDWEWELPVHWSEIVDAEDSAWALCLFDDEREPANDG